MLALGIAVSCTPQAGAPLVPTLNDEPPVGTHSQDDVSTDPDPVFEEPQDDSLSTDDGESDDSSDELDEALDDVPPQFEDDSSDDRSEDSASDDRSRGNAPHDRSRSNSSDDDSSDDESKDNESEDDRSRTS